MEVSNPRDDRAERNLGGASVPLSTVIPWVGNFHLEQNPIQDSYRIALTLFLGFFELSSTGFIVLAVLSLLYHRVKVPKIKKV